MKSTYIPPLGSRMASLCQCHGRSLAKLMRRAAGASEIDGTVGAGSGMNSVVPGVKRSHTTAGPERD